MMKKYRKIAVGFGMLVYLVIITILMCEIKKGNVSDKVPEILFTYKYEFGYVTEGEDLGIIYIFDNKGNVYSSTEEEIIKGDYSKILEKVNSGELNAVGKVSVSVVREKFNLLKAIARNRKFELKETEQQAYPDVVSDYLWWEGYYYTRKDEIKSILFYQYTTFRKYYKSTDSRAYDIAEWMYNVTKKISK